jgi:mannose-binding lectin
MSGNVQWTNPLDLSWIPNDKLVTFTAMHQAGYTQYFQVIDANGNPILFSPLDGSLELPFFPISGTGSKVGFFTNGYGSFTKSDGMQIQFGSDGPNVPSVATAGPYQLFADNACRGGGTTYVTEDGDDMDYNDTAVVLQWYDRPG